MKSVESVLSLERLIFDKIEFNRKGFKNDNDIKFGIKVQIGNNGEDITRVTITLSGNKEKEFDMEITLSGYFSISRGHEENVNEEKLINTNAVAIMMPYLRSEVSLLTAQPGVDCVVMPPFNINKLLDSNE